MQMNLKIWMQVDQSSKAFPRMTQKYTIAAQQQRDSLGSLTHRSLHHISWENVRSVIMISSFRRADFKKQHEYRRAHPAAIADATHEKRSGGGARLSSTSKWVHDFFGAEIAVHQRLSPWSSR